MNTSKKDLYWTVAVAAVILLAVVTFWLGGKGNEMVSYISFASAIVAIILALVAIFYSIVQNVNSQQNIGEMRTLVSEASRIMTEKARTLVEQAVSMEDHIKRLAPLLEPSAKVSGTARPLEKETFRFDASASSNAFLLTLYYLAKCHELKKPMELWPLATLADDLPEEESERVITKVKYQLFGIGILQCLQCFWGSQNIVLSYEDNEMKAVIKELPSGFQENILEVIENAIPNIDEPSVKESLSTGMKKIDAFVAA